tara:strand:+ start:777 stop:2801 length:2025 start_codon:yes stop_codon:yes gene_type:complete
MNISKVINDVVDTVSYKTSNGMVDVKDPYHLYLLKEEFEKWLDPDLVYSALFEAEKDAEPPLDDKEKEKAKKMGLVWKGKGYGKENEDGISFKNQGGKLVKIEKDKEKQKDDPQKLTAKDLTSKTGEPEKQEFNDKESAYHDKISQGLQNEADYMEFENDADKQSFIQAAQKLGDDPNSLTKDDIKIINKYARIADSSRPKLYTARKLNDFSSGRGKIEVVKGKSKIASEYLEKLKKMGIKVAAASTVKGSQQASKFRAKDLTAGKLSNNRVRKETVSSTENSVTVGKTTLTKTEITSDMDSRERASAERKNAFIEKVKQSDSIEFVETIEGADESTEEGREKICREYPEEISKFIKDSLGTDVTPEEQSIVDQVEALGKIDDPEEYEKAALKIINDMDQVGTIRKGAADLTESIVYLVLNKRGIPTKLPAGETFKVSDLISFPPDNVDNVAPQSIVNLTKEGGVSVKMKGGAPSGGEEKIKQSKFKNTETQDKLLKIIENHNKFFTTGGGITQEEVDEGDRSNREIEDWARSQGILSDDDEIKTRDGRTPEEWAEDTMALWESKGKVRNLTPEEREMFKAGLAGFCRGGLLMEKVYNSDLDSQEFGNVNLKTYKSKDAELEISDGVESASLMYFVMNPGFKFTKDFKPQQPTAVYAGKLVHADYDRESGKFKK